MTYQLSYNVFGISYSLSHAADGYGTNIVFSTRFYDPMIDGTPSTYTHLSYYFHCVCWCWSSDILKVYHMALNSLVKVISVVVFYNLIINKFIEAWSLRSVSL